jgi:hypothetical protein
MTIVASFTDFTEEDLQQMKTSLLRLEIRTQFKKDHWIKGFFLYNMCHTETERLSVNCYSCYTKVYLWCKEQMKKKYE